MLARALYVEDSQNQNLPRSPVSPKPALRAARLARTPSIIGNQIRASPVSDHLRKFNATLLFPDSRASPV